MPTILKNHYALYMELFTTPSVDKFVTFYEAISIHPQMANLPDFGVRLKA